MNRMWYLASEIPRGDLPITNEEDVMIRVFDADPDGLDNYAYFGKCEVCGTSVTSQFIHVFIEGIEWICDDCWQCIGYDMDYSMHVFGIEIPSHYSYVERVAFALGMNAARMGM